MRWILSLGLCLMEPTLASMSLGAANTLDEMCAAVAEARGSVYEGERGMEAVA